MPGISSREKVLWYVASALVVVYALFPVAWIVSLSLKAPSDLTNQQFLPTQVSLENYEQILVGPARGLFLPALGVSVVVSALSTLFAVVLATFCAYAIARLDFPGKRLILGAALAVSIFPVISIVTPLFNVWRLIGLYDTIPGLVIPYMALTLPLSIWVLSAFFRQIPWELEQAAQVDGATTWQAFRKVIVPLAAPGVFTTAIIAFFIAWNDFVFGISLTSTERARPVPAALAFFTGESQFVEPTGAIAAAAVLVTVPVVVLVLIFQRRIVSGLTSGAVKG
jgi:multiple sugar transport system permease protein